MQSEVTNYGPTLPISEEIHALKYRGAGETFYQAMTRVADAMADDMTHFYLFRHILLGMRFVPAGRIQAAMGSPRITTPYNCFVSDTIDDSMDGIMLSASRAAQTMRLGGGLGSDFSPLRPRNDLIRSLDSTSSGPVSFMKIHDAVCGTISSAGHRRGALMGVLRVDHPDIEEFINAKQNTHNLTNFNLSIAVTDEFMNAVEYGLPFDLRWGGRVYRTIDARALWDKIMRSTWDWAEPGVLFIDRINAMNNLRYCETIAATNPCAEQPLPPNGACLLGSFNLTKYIYKSSGGYAFNWPLFADDIKVVVRAMDNVIDRAIYPLPEQEEEAKSKRRMGLGIMGLANAGEALGLPYGSQQFCEFTNTVLRTLANTAYRTSTLLAREKGSFPAFEGAYLDSEYLKHLDPEVVSAIKRYGIRNSHLISIAPTGTISLTCDNVSSGIEPVFSHSFTRTINTPSGAITETIEDYGVRVFGVRGKTADECSIDDHLAVLGIASLWADSAVSKTCNIGPDVNFDEFKNVYLRAYKMGAKGCTTFRANGKRAGILQATPKSEESEGAACYFDPETGQRSCA